MLTRNDITLLGAVAIAAATALVIAGINIYDIAESLRILAGR